MNKTKRSYTHCLVTQEFDIKIFLTKGRAHSHWCYPFRNVIDDSSRSAKSDLVKNNQARKPERTTNNEDQT